MPFEVATTSPELSPEAQKLLKSLRQPRKPDVLLVAHHPPDTHVFRLSEGGTATVGRNKNLEVSVVDPSVSRQHAQFTLKGGVVEVEDLGSRHGTLLRLVS